MFVNKKKLHLPVRCCFAGCFFCMLNSLRSPLQNLFLTEFLSSCQVCKFACPSQYPKSLPRNINDLPLLRKSSWIMPTNILCCSSTRWAMSTQPKSLPSRIIRHGSIHHASAKSLVSWKILFVPTSR